MVTFYLVIIIVLFLLAISDLIVGVSNDAVNFLNSAVGAKAATFKLILIVAALGIIVGCTFSSGMMEVARKGIFHPQYFYFSEIILLFLAVMVTDVILLDTFNTFGMPTSTTVSIVFELLGAAVALSLIKIYTDPNALNLGDYINSGKALAIIAGILLSVVIAFSAGMIFQYLTRLLFSFDYEKRLRYFGSIWGGLAIAAITYFMLIKGVKGSSFMDEPLKAIITNNAFRIISLSFIGWAILLQIITWFTKIDILKLIVLVGTFALAMAFAGNDLVNFIGVPLAGFNSYQLYVESGGTGAGSFLMGGLAGKVPTPTLLLLLAGVIMTLTLWTSKKARSVVQTSLDLGRQHEGSERFTSYAVSRTLVRNFGKVSEYISDHLPKRVNNAVDRQFDERPFIAKQAKLGKEAPSFDMVRASVTLVVASILISIGTAMKLPLSTTYVTFMVFMGTSLADGAWGRESAVYRVSGVISVIGGWFFTAFSAFTIAFVLACIFYFGGTVAIGLTLVIAAIIVYRSHKYHNKRIDEEIAFLKSITEEKLDRESVIESNAKNLTDVLGSFNNIIDKTLQYLAAEDLKRLNKVYTKFSSLYEKTEKLKMKANNALDRIAENDLEAGHAYILTVEYLREMAHHVKNIVKTSLSHVDNNHKPLLPEQIEELKSVQDKLKERFGATITVFNTLDESEAMRVYDELSSFVKSIRTIRKNQIKRIRNHEIGTRNSLLFLSHLAEFRNLALFSNRLVRVYEDMIIHPEDEEVIVHPEDEAVMAHSENKEVEVHPEDEEIMA